eukprot:6632678-Pyramimonas_sp.AAC.1
MAAVTSSQMYSLLHWPRTALCSCVLMFASFSRKYVRRSSLTVVFVENDLSRSYSVSRLEM